MVRDGDRVRPGGHPAIRDFCAAVSGRGACWCRPIPATAMAAHRIGAALSASAPLAVLPGRTASAISLAACSSAGGSPAWATGLTGMIGAAVVTGLGGVLLAVTASPADRRPSYTYAIEFELQVPVADARQGVDIAECGCNVGLREGAMYAADQADLADSSVRNAGGVTSVSLALQCQLSERSDR